MTVTQEAYEAAQEQRREWLKNLAEALKKWCDENGYKPRGKLVSEIEDLSMGKLHHLLKGDSMIEDPEDSPALYARIHVRTGLEEADPRTVPPRFYRPKAGKRIEKKKSWTTQEYRAWLQVNVPGADIESLLGISETGELDAIPPSENGKSPRSQEHTVGEMHEVSGYTDVDQLQAGQDSQLDRPLRSFVGELPDSLVPDIAEGLHKLGEELRSSSIVQLHSKIDELYRVVVALSGKIDNTSVPRTTGEGAMDIGDLLHRTNVILRSCLDGTVEDRNRISEKYGRKLGALYVVTGILTIDDVQRREKVLSDSILTTT